MDISIRLHEINELLKSGKALEARERFNALPEQPALEYFLLKGKLEQKFQNWGEALNAYSRVLEIDPGNSEAKNNMQVIRGILNFWNPEMFNP